MKILIQKDICASMFTVTLLTTAKIGTQLQWSLVDEECVVRIHIITLFSHKKIKS